MDPIGFAQVCCCGLKICIFCQKMRLRLIDSIDWMPTRETFQNVYVLLPGYHTNCTFDVSHHLHSVFNSFLLSSSPERNKVSKRGVSDDHRDMSEFFLWRKFLPENLTFTANIADFHGKTAPWSVPICKISRINEFFFCFRKD